MKLHVFMDNVGESTGKRGAAPPSHMAARFRLGYAVEISERVLHRDHFPLVVPGVFLDVRTQVTSDLDSPLGHQCRQQTRSDLVDQRLEVTRMPMVSRVLHHSHKPSKLPVCPMWPRIARERCFLCPSGAFQVGDDAPCNTHDVCRRSTKHVIPRSRSSPHLVILQQIRINKHSQLCAVTKGRNAAVGLRNPTITRCCHTKSLTKTTLVTGKIIPSTASLNGTTLLMMRAGSSAPDDTRSSTGLAVAHACTRPIS